MSTWPTSLCAALAVAGALLLAGLVDPPGLEDEAPAAGAGQRTLELGPIYAALAAEGLALAAEVLERPAAPGHRPSDDDAVAAVLPLPLDVWPLHLTEGRLDAIAFRDEVLHIATHEAPRRPLIEPAIVRVRALGPDGAEAEAPWEARILGPSPLALATSAEQTLAAWSHRAHPGRDLVTLRFSGSAADARHEVLRPPDDEPFTPRGRPLLAPAADGGWLVCSSGTAGRSRCVHLDADGTATWQTLAGLRSYPLWRLVPVASGYHLFATDCSPDTCASFRVVLQELDSRGEPRGQLRVITRLQASRRHGVFAAGGGSLLFGRRASAKASTALLITRRGTTELAGRWDRTAGGVAHEGGALLIELDGLRMVEGLPVTGHRPRRLGELDQIARRGRRDIRRDDRDIRLERESWPATVDDHVPPSLDQVLLVDHDALALLAPSGADLTLRGAAIRLGSSPATDPQAAALTP